MTPEQIALILGALGMGGVITKIIDVLFKGWKESRAAREVSKDEAAGYKAEIAFWSETVQETRELFLREGGDPVKLGPPPRYKPHKTVKMGEKHD